MAASPPDHFKSAILWAFVEMTSAKQLFLFLFRVYVLGVVLGVLLMQNMIVASFSG